MIRVTKMNGSAILLNADWIQSVESTPDTLITLTTGFQLLVRDTAEQIAQAFLNYKKESGSMLRTTLPEGDIE